MSQLRDFEWYLEKRVVRMCNKDVSMARDLAQESERKEASLRQTLSKVGLTDLNANEITEYCYDIIMLLIRAKLLLEGLRSSGDSAHEAEVSYLRKLNFSEVEVKFANQLRFFRNGMKYYGKRMDSEYAKKSLDFLKRVYPRLRAVVKPFF